MHIVRLNPVTYCTTVQRVVCDKACKPDGPPRAFKVTKIIAIRKAKRDFLLVCHLRYISINTYLRKRFKTSRALFTPIWGVLSIVYIS